MTLIPIHGIVLNRITREMNYLKARRILFGASHGAWDAWEYESPWVVATGSKDFFDK